MQSEVQEFVDLLVDYVKGVYDTPNTEGRRIPMYYKGEYLQGERYEAGDVVTIRALGIFQAEVSTVADPRISSDDWNTVFAAAGGAASGGSPLVPVMQVDNITPLVNNQTTFNLSTAPTYPSTVIVNINGVDYHSFGDFTIAGSTVTWLNLFQIQSSDRVVIRYF